MNFSKIVFSASVAALVTVFGCSSSSSSTNEDICGAVGAKNCPNDPAQTQASVDLCNKCKSQFLAYANCENVSTALHQCDANGKTIAAKTDSSKCMTELKAATDCVTK